MSLFAERLLQQRVGVGIFVTLALLPLAALLFWKQPEAPALDPHTGCRLDGLKVHRIVLIDATDTIDATQKEAILNLVRKLGDETLPFEKLSLVVIDAGQPREPPPLFSACAPQLKADRADENPLFLRAAWLRGFYGPLLTAARTALVRPKQDETPLIESIYGLSRRADFGSDVPTRSLYIVSDMLQHTASLYDQYHDGLKYEDFKRRPYAYQNLPNLSGVEIVGFYIDRPERQCVQGEAQRRFWDDFFRETKTAIHYLNWPWVRSGSLRDDNCSRHSPGGVALPRHRHRRRHAGKAESGRN
jgi:hypothetical protein